MGTPLKKFLKMACFALFCVGNKNRLPIVFFVYAIYTYPAVVNSSGGNGQKRGRDHLKHCSTRIEGVRGASFQLKMERRGKRSIQQQTAASQLPRPELRHHEKAMH